MRKYKRIDPIIRFTEKYIPEPNTGCWLWIAGEGPTGYGTFNIPGKPGYKAHRFSYEYFKGSAIGFDVCHKCDTPLCVNPEHLFLGTRKDNMADAVLKGRTLKGIKHPLAVLNEKQVKEIKILLKHKIGLRFIASSYKVHIMTISDINRGATWTHL